VHEDILRAVIRRNEPVTLLIVEPLHFACSQCRISLLVSVTLSLLSQQDGPKQLSCRRVKFS
jgi:hypothetical protein